MSKHGFYMINKQSIITTKRYLYASRYKPRGIIIE